jgi:hypothetical protein
MKLLTIRTTPQSSSQYALAAGALCRRLVLVIIGLLLPIVVLEIVFRVAGPIVPGNYELGVWREAHAVYRRFHVPGSSAWLRTPEFATHLRFNSYGLRGDDVTLEPTPGTLRVLVIGDSFVEAGGVAEDETMVARLQALLDRPNRPVQVLNAGMYGWGPAEEYLYLEREGLRFRPDLVVQVIYIGNDITNSLPRGRDERENPGGPVFEIDNAGRLRQLPWSLPEQGSSERLAAALRSRSWAFRAFETGVVSKLAEPPSGITPRRLSIYRDRESRDVAESWRVVEALLAATNDRARDAGVPFLLAIAPAAWQVDSDDWDAIVRELKLADPNGWNMRKPDQRLTEIANRSGVPVIDLLPPMRAEATTTRLYFPLDRHWNASGNRVASEAVYNAIRSTPALLQSPHLLSPNTAGEGSGTD